jgi:hypothetical protein
MKDDNYYNRKSEMDWIEEHAQGMKGCRNLIIITIAFWAFIVLLIILIKK